MVVDDSNDGLAALGIPEVALAVMTEAERGLIAALVDGSLKPEDIARNLIDHAAASSAEE